MAGRSDIQAGKAFVEVYAKTGALTTGLADARRRLHDFGTAAAMMGAALAASGMAIVGPIGKAIHTFASFGSELNDMANRTGVAASALAELKFAAEQSGAGLSDVEVAIRNVQRRVVDAADGSKSAKEALAHLGLTAEQLKHKTPDQQLQMVADRLAAVPDPAKKAAYAIDLLGKSGAQLLPMVDELGALRAEARRLGLVPTDQAIKDAALIGNLFAKIRSVAIASIFEIGSAVGPLLIPVLERVKEIGASFALWVRHNGEIIRTVARVGAGLIAAGTAITAFGSGLVLASRLLGIVQSSLALFRPLINPAVLAMQAFRFATEKISAVAGIAVRAYRGLTAVISQAAIQASGIVSGIAAAGWRMATSVASAAVAAGRAIYTAIATQVTRLAGQVPAALSRIAVAARAAFAASTNAAASFGREATYWLARPWQYFSTIAPQLGARTGNLFTSMMARLQSAGANAATWIQNTWSMSMAKVNAVVTQVATYISTRFTSVANPVAARIAAAWTAMASAVSSRVGAAWNSISAATSVLANRIRTFLGPVLPMLQQDFGRIAGYARAGFSGTIAVARSAANGVVAAWRFAGPAIARSLTTAVGGAFTRIQAIGSATAGNLARGFGSGMRGLSGLLSGGAGLLGILGANAGGLLGQLAMIAPQLLMIGSSLGMLLNPATLLIAAVAGGIYVWTQYSESGKAALAAVQSALKPFLDIAKSTFAGISAAISAGNLALAGKIAMAGLKLAFVTGMEELGNSIGGTWGKTVSDIGSKLAGGDFAGAWETAVLGMAAVWDAWSEGVVKTFTAAISSVIDVWKAGVDQITDFLLEASAGGGALGKIASGILGVDMQNEKQRNGVMEEQARLPAIRNQEKMLAAHEQSLAGAKAAGNAADIAKFQKAVDIDKAKLAELKGGKAGPDFMAHAKGAAREFTADTATALKQALAELDRDAEAKAQQSQDNLAGHLPVGPSDARRKAQAELDALRGQADREKAWGDIEKMLAEKDADAVANGGKDAAGVKDLLETKSLGSTFSAAAAIAMGRGGGANPQLALAQKQLQQQQDAAKFLKESKEVIKQSQQVLAEIARNTRKTVAKAGK